MRPCATKSPAYAPTRSLLPGPRGGQSLNTFTAETPEPNGNSMNSFKFFEFMYTFVNVDWIHSGRASPLPIEEHGYASLCCEVARVCANKVTPYHVLLKEPRT